MAQEPGEGIGGATDLDQFYSGGGAGEGNVGGGNSGAQPSSTIFGAPDPDDGDGGGSSADGGDAGSDTANDGFARDRFGNRIVNQDGSYRKRRRARGTRGSGPAPKASTKLAVGGIEAILVSTHGMIAAMSKVPAWELSEAEAKPIAQGIANVARHYPDLPVTQKTIDLYSLMAILLMAYGPRLGATVEAMKAKSAKDVTPRPRNVAPIAPEQTGPVASGIMPNPVGEQPDFEGDFLDHLKPGYEPGSL